MTKVVHYEWWLLIHGGVGQQDSGADTPENKELLEHAEQAYTLLENKKLLERAEQVYTTLMEALQKCHSEL